MPRRQLMPDRIMARMPAPRSGTPTRRPPCLAHAAVRPVVAPPVAGPAGPLATLAPLFSVLLFLAAIISAFWYLRNEEIERETESVKRDTEITQQQINLRLIQNQEQLMRMARELVTREVDQVAFAALAADEFTRERPEIRHLNWIGARRNLKATLLPAALPSRPSTGPASPDPSLPQAPRQRTRAGLPHAGRNRPADLLPARSTRLRGNPSSSSTCR
jgi:hypothetical protein